MSCINLLKGVVPALLLATPLLLTGCEAFNDPYNNSPSYDYNYDRPTAAVTTSPNNAAPNARVQTNGTTMVQPGISTVKTPRPAASSAAATATKASSATDGPSVPNMAPTVGQ